MGKLLTKLGKFWRAVRERGLSRAIDVSCAHLLANERRRFEQQYGLDTEREVMLDELTIESDRKDIGFYYGASHPRVVTTLIESVAFAVADSTFIDYGSGKGLVLLVASQYPFGKVIGVEFARELHEIAEQNIARFVTPRRKCDAVESVNQDAAQFELSDGDCVLYFCNPFADSVMREVLDNIERSWRANPRNIYILFQQLVEEEDISMADPVPMFEQSDFLDELPVKYGSWWDRLLLKHLRMRVYRTPQSTS